MKLAIIYFIFYNFYFNLFQGQLILNSFNSLFFFPNNCKNNLWHPPYRLNLRPSFCNSVSVAPKQKEITDKSNTFAIFSSENIVETLPNSPDSMPSFTEWKKKMLFESGEQAQTLTLPDPSSKIIPSDILPPANIKGTNERVRNYASYECGAKVIASNPEAESTSRILNEFMDEYLLNPCKAKIWFVIELCESLRPSSFQLANFELFSSTPKDFLVYGSDQYPTNEWLNLGTFTAQDVRSLQRFELVSQSQYLKYIKIEMLSNHGFEHYCPLSVIRIYGTSMVEEFDAIERSSRTKKIETTTEDIKKEIELSNAEESFEKQNLFGTSREAVISKKAAIILSQNQPSISINCTSSDHLEVGVDFDLSMHSLLIGLIMTLKNNNNLNWSKCWKKETLCVNCTLNLIYCDYLKSFLGNKLYKIVNAEFFKDEEFRFKCLKNVFIYSNLTVESFKNSTVENFIMPLNFSNKTLPIQVKISEINKLNESSFPFKKKLASSINPESTQPIFVSTLSIKVVPSLTEASPTLISNIHNEPNFENNSNSFEVFDPISVNVINDSAFSVSDFVEISKVQAFSDSSSTVKSSFQQSLSTPQFVQPLVQPSQPPIKEINVVPLSGTQSKESVFIRMSNKIRALELNLSLSSQYLEELSQSYRKNMEEMQKAFNRTITKLNETARFAAQQDDKQQEMLEELQRKYFMIEEKVNLLVNEKETLHWHFVEMHFIILIIEIIVVICTFSICFRRLSNRFEQTKTHKYTFNSTYLKQRLNQPLKRPNFSFNENSNPSPAKSKRLEGNLIIVEPNYSIFAPTNSIKNKKRKKKRNIWEASEKNKNQQAKVELELSNFEPKFEEKLNFRMESETKEKLKPESTLINCLESNEKRFFNWNEKFNFDSKQLPLTIDKLSLANHKNYQLKNSKKFLSKSNSSSSSGISLDSNLSNKTVIEKQLKNINEDSLINNMKNNSNVSLSSKSIFNWKKLLKFEKK